MLTESFKKLAKVISKVLAERGISIINQLKMVIKEFTF